jgi:hypothetical protein
MAPAVNLIFSLFSLLFTGNYQRLAALRRRKPGFVTIQRIKNSEKTADDMILSGHRRPKRRLTKRQIIINN